MFTVALVGPDGAGKTTVGQKLEHNLSHPVKYLYMGVSSDSSNVMLPTTRIARAIKRAAGAKPDTAGPPDPNQILKPKSKGPIKQLVGSLRASLRLINRLCEEWFRQGLAWYYQRKGKIVVFDRHFFSDYYAYDIANKDQTLPLTRRIHGFVLEHIYPKPDLVIYLDAPAEVLFARKGEGSIEALERRRRDYLQLQNLVENFSIVDATQAQGEVVGAVIGLIENYNKVLKGGLINSYDS